MIYRSTRLVPGEHGEGHLIWTTRVFIVQNKTPPNDQCSKFNNNQVYPDQQVCNIIEITLIYIEVGGGALVGGCYKYYWSCSVIIIIIDQSIVTFMRLKSSDF